MSYSGGWDEGAAARQSAGKADEVARRINYVPGQICIVVAGPPLSHARGGVSGVAMAPSRTSAESSREPEGPSSEPMSSPILDAPTLYAATRDFLNARARELLPKQAIPNPEQDPFGYDLSPALIQQRLRSTSAPDIFEPLRPSSGMAPWAPLPRRDDQGQVSLLFYNILSLGAEPRVVRELVNFVNRLPSFQIGNTPYVVQAATPNWLSAPAPHSCGGPGSEPAAVPKADAADWTFDFSHPSLKELVDEARCYRRDGEPTPPSGVVVAVLDTSPDANEVRDAASPARPTSTWLLREVALGPRPAQIAEPPSLPDPGGFAAVVNPTFTPNPITANWRGAFCDPAFNPHRFLMPDHGLFATGIIRDVAPGADLRLIRVLGDYGVGDLLGLTTVLSTLLSMWQSGAIEGKHLILNLSLMVDVPPYSPHARPDEQRLFTLWFPESFNVGKLPEPGDPRLPPVLDPIHQSIFQAVLALAESDVLIVAAAGNDGLSHGLHPNPRLPAAYDAVLGVAALNEEEKPAAYTNQGDEEAPLALNTGVGLAPNGIAVWGGNATLHASCRFADEEATINLHADPVDAIKGIFTRPELPGGEANQTGWVYWVGTSFATPIISGIAADVWAKDARLTSDKVAQEIRTTYASQPNSPLGVPIIVAYQSRT